MSTKYEQWRAADHQAHVAERQIISARSGWDTACSDEVPDFHTARQARALADKLFREAMTEVEQEVRRALAQVRSQPF